MVTYQTRLVERRLDGLLAGVPAVLLDGPKAVGKTTTAQQRADRFVTFDDPLQVEAIRADPEAVANNPGLVVIDEWQRFPDIWNVVRRAVDADPRPGRFLLTGSASFTDQSLHSGAGRIVPIQMRPMSLFERGVSTGDVSLAALAAGGRAPVTGSTEVRLPDYVDEIFSGGFPGIRRLPPQGRLDALRGYVDLIVERDVDDAGHQVRRPAMLRRWLRAYAAATATTASFETIRDAATGGEGGKPARATITPLRDALERIWIVDPLAAWAPVGTYIRALRQAPKHHLADPALAAAALGVAPDQLLLGRGPTTITRRDSILAALFESLVTLDVRIYADLLGAQVQHLRVEAGRHEVDLIVEMPDGRVVAIEVKLSAAVDDDDLRHLHWLRERIGDQLADAVVVTTGRFAYRRPDGIAVVPAALLGP